MKLQPFVDKLNATNQFREFINKYNDAFLAAGFFILDLEMGQKMYQLDYYIPSEKKFAAFTLGRGTNMQILNTITNTVPEKLDSKTSIDIDALEGILEDEMKNRSITEEIKKIIAVVQNIKGRKVWNVNCILSGMEILKAHVEDETKTILKMEKTSFVDLMKKIPTEQLRLPTEGKEGEGPAEMDENAVVDNIKKLEKLEQSIEEEKSRLKKKLGKEKKSEKKK